MARIWISVSLMLGLVGSVRGEQQDGRPDPSFPQQRGVRVHAGLATPPGQEPGVTTKGREQGQTRLVYRLKAAPATSLSTTINQLLPAGGQPVVIVPDAISNSLVIAGPPDAVDEVRKLAEQLDHPAVMVRMEVLLVEIPTTGKAAATETFRPDALPEHSEILARGELTTLENQPASLQVGRREARITAISMSQAGRTNSVTFDNVGTRISLTPRVEADRTVTAEINVEDSRLGPREEGVAVMIPVQGEPVRTPNVETFMVKTTVRIPEGKSVLVGGMASESRTGKQRALVVTPHVLPMSGEASVGREKRRQAADSK